MIVTLPFIPEICDYKVMAERFVEAGANVQHSLYVITRTRDSVLAQDFLDATKHLFNKTGIKFLPELKWRGQLLRNEFFRTAAKTAHLHPELPEEYTGAPYLYLDPHYYPCNVRWCEVLQSEYVMSHAKVMGWCDKEPPPVTVDTNGEKKEFAGGKVFIGSLVLWRNFWVESAMLPNLDEHESWRTAMRWELAASHASIPKLFRGNMLAALRPFKPLKNRKQTIEEDDPDIPM